MDLRGKARRDKVLPIVLVVAIIGVIGALRYVIATPEVGENFTEGKPYFKNLPRPWVDGEWERGGMNELFSAII